MGWDQTYLVVERVLGLMSEDAEGKEAVDSKDSWTYATEREREREVPTPLRLPRRRRERSLQARACEVTSPTQQDEEEPNESPTAISPPRAARMIHQRRRSAALALDLLSPLT
nr:unnamed protein product [Digitaria exilis]